MPNVDLVRIAIIVVLVGIITALVLGLGLHELGAGAGLTQWEHLNTAPVTHGERPLSWSPMSVATQLMPILGIDVPLYVRMFAAAGLAAVGVVLLVKVIMRVLGS